MGKIRKLMFKIPDQSFLALKFNFIIKIKEKRVENFFEMICDRMNFIDSNFTTCLHCMKSIKVCLALQ